MQSSQDQPHKDGENPVEEERPQDDVESAAESKERPPRAGIPPLATQRALRYGTGSL